MSRGRTSWYAHDAAWHRRELIVELGEEHGPPAISVLTALKGMAQEQRHPDGEVLTGYRTLAREAFVDVAKARSIVEAAAAIGVVDDLSQLEDGKRFTCRVSGWRADQEKGRAAFRQAASRARRADETAQESGKGTVTSHSGRDNVTPDEAESRDVTEKPPPDITKQEPPVVPQGGRDRDRTKYEKDLDAWAAHHFPERDPHDVTLAISMLRNGRPRRHANVDTVTEWLRDRDERWALDAEETEVPAA